ncbi:MAG: hypothetical protein MI861_02900 [Pirellulales bacterium]|nr:hypothetical protein [Pirellulales bacterium]
MKLGVAYLLTNADYAARVVVSIDSLRRWYDGPIMLVTTQPSAHELGRRFQNDARLRVSLKELSFDHPTKNFAYLTKTSLFDHSPFDVTVFLDADTLVADDPDEFLRAARGSVLTVTCHANWQTTDTHRRKLLSGWRNIHGAPRFRERVNRLVDFADRVPLPAINSGVFAISRHTSLLKDWQQLAAAGKECPIPDELALQLLLPEYEFQIFGSQYNASPATPPPDVKIWHFLGRNHLTEPAARAIWLPAYRDCFRRNVAAMAEWSRIDETQFRAV